MDNAKLEYVPRKTRQQRGVVLCIKCMGTGTFRLFVETGDFSGYKNVVCPECEGKGRLWRIVKIEYELIKEQV